MHDFEVQLLAQNQPPKPRANCGADFVAALSEGFVSEPFVFDVHFWWSSSKGLTSYNYLVHGGGHDREKEIVRQQAPALSEPVHSQHMEWKLMPYRANAEEKDVRNTFWLAVST